MKNENNIAQDTNGNRYIKPVFEKVLIEKDIVFAQVKNNEILDETLKLDVYTPIGDTEELRPVIIWIHGGGFRPGNDKTQSYIVTLANEFTRRGYVSVSTDYRLRDKENDDKVGTLRDAESDVRLAFNWIKANSEKYSIDKNRIIIAGGSAGGMTAVNLCLKEIGGSDLRDRQGIIALLDLWGSPNIQLTLGEVDKDFPPTIIIHGTNDKLVSFNESERFANNLKSMDVNYLLYPIEGAGHTPVSHMNKIIGYISEFLSDLI